MRLNRKTEQFGGQSGRARVRGSACGFVEVWCRMARCKCIDARAHSPCRSICMRLHTFPPRPCAWPSVGKTCLPCRAQGSQLARAQRDTLHLRCDPRKRGGEQFAVDDEKQHDRHTVRSGDGKDGVALLQCSPLPSFALPREEEGRRKVNQESVSKKGVVSASKVARREDGGGAEPQERRSTSPQRAPSCPPHPAAWF